MTVSKALMVGSIGVTLAVIVIVWVLVGPLAADLIWPRLSYHDVAEERSPLIDSLQSYDSIERIRQLMAKAGLDWKILSDDQREGGGWLEKPRRYRVYVARVPGYTTLGVKGELELAFFNDRLMRVVFISENIEMYLERLKSTASVSFRTERGVSEARIEPYTRVEVYRRDKGALVIGWTDTRLERERLLWERRYSFLWERRHPLAAAGHVPQRHF